MAIYGELRSLANQGACLSHLRAGINELNVPPELCIEPHLHVHYLQMGLIRRVTYPERRRSCSTLASAQSIGNYTLEILEHMKNGQGHL